MSRPPTGKALDLLQHHANQYYSAHKIHELQERALKSPTPKGVVVSSSASPSSSSVVVGQNPTRPPSGPPTGVGTPQSQQSSGKQPPPQQQQQQQPPGQQPSGPIVEVSGVNLGKDSRTSSSPPPPPPRLVHHTHLDIGYSILNGQYPAPYGGKPLVRP